MDDTTFLGILISLLILLISCIYYFAIRDNNQTKRFVATQKSETETFVSKAELEGKKFQVAANERIEQVKAQSAQELKKMDVIAHQATLAFKTTKQEKILEATQIVENSAVKRTQIQCQTAKDLTSMELGFHRTLLQSEDSRFQSSLDFQSALLGSSHDLKNRQIEAETKTAELFANTSKYIADKNLEGQICWDSGETARVELGSQARLAIGRQALNLERERQSFASKLAEKKLTTSASCFREQMEFNKIKEYEKTGRAKIKAAATATKALGDLASLAVGGRAAGAGLLPFGGAITSAMSRGFQGGTDANFCEQPVLPSMTSQTQPPSSVEEVQN